MESDSELLYLFGAFFEERFSGLSSIVQLLLAMKLAEWQFSNVPKKLQEANIYLRVPREWYIQYYNFMVYASVR